MERLCVIIVLLFVVGFRGYGQEQQHCDTIFRVVDKEPAYSGGQPAMTRYLHKELMPAVGECYTKDSIMITRMTIELVINSTGQVDSVTFSDAALSPVCRELLRKRVLSMKGWEPARVKGQPVCSYYKQTIACILWEE